MDNKKLDIEKQLRFRLFREYPKVCVNLQTDVR